MAVDVCQICNARCCNWCGADFTEEEMLRVISSGFSPDLFNKLGDNHYEAKCCGRKCPFLNGDNKCSIYDIRPRSCVSFPLWFRSEKLELAMCPLGKIMEGQDLSRFEKVADEAKDLMITCYDYSKNDTEDLKSSYSDFLSLKWIEVQRKNTQLT
jgi:Fe-S-cluster containining protein